MQEQENSASKPFTHALIKMLMSIPQITQFIRSKPSSEQFQHAKEALITNLRNDGVQEESIRFFEAVFATRAASNQEILGGKETCYQINFYLICGNGEIRHMLLHI